METVNMRVRITTTEEMLGMANANPNIHEKYIASKAPDALSIKDEVEAVGVDKVVEEMTTIFPRGKDGSPIMWNYQMKGFFKDACGMLRKVKGSQSSKIKAYKKEIDGLIFIKEREIPIRFDGEMDVCERPLRASTPQGERVALARSETIPAGATLEFTILLLSTSHIKLIKECLDYGELRGLCQWRNSGKGSFLWEELDSEGKVIGGNNK